MQKTKYLHIAIIILGIIFISIPVFHSNLWFDESYSVGMANKSFIDIWNIGSNDVHPILYYWILHIIYLIFGTNLYLYRIISVIPLAILGILGYTHIRKDFGEKEGILFSFFTFFLPISCVYSGEIRMYTWAMLFVTVMAIYAYRIYKNSSIKNWIIFAIFSLASACTHYYALATAGIINLILFIYLLKKGLKQKSYTKELKCFTISAIAQIVLYIPWLQCLIKQIFGVAKGFWIPKLSIETLIQTFCFQFTGDLDTMCAPQLVSITLGLILLAYCIYCIIINKGEKLAGKLAIGVYLIVFSVMAVVSIEAPIFYPRYFLNLTGLFMFFMAFFMAKDKQKILTIIVCAITFLTAVFVNLNVIKMNYAENNKLPIEYVKQDLQQGDMILFGNRGSGFAISMQFENVPNCFYDYDNWNVEPAYRAFGKEMIYTNSLDVFEDYKGRIWLVDSDNYSIYEKFKEEYGDKIKLVKQDIFYTEYHKYNYSICLIEKDI